MNIILKDIKLLGYHGVHPLENICGTEFIVNIVIGIDNKQPIKSLSETIDYAAVYQLMKQVFSATEQLLEVVAEKIFIAIAERFPMAADIEICILKSNPPIDGFMGQVGVQLKKEQMKFNCLLSIWLLSTVHLSAQQSPMIEEARILERQFKTMDAIRKYESLMSNDQRNIHVLVRLAELYCMEGQSKEKEEERKSMFDLAGKYAAKANAIDSNRADVQYANAMVIGKMIEFASIKEKTRLTMVLREKTDKSLAIDPNYTKAIYTLAKWNDEVSSLNPAARAALKMMNKGFPAASAEEAINLYEKARKLDPGFIVNNHDLALAYKKMGKSLQAIELLNYQLKLPAKTKEDQEIKLKSKQLLESLK